MSREQGSFQTLQRQNVIAQKRGIHFILTSVILWFGIAIIQKLDIPVLSKNMLTFCMSALLMPLAYFFSKLLHIPFSDKENPFSALGIVLSLAQLPYLLIVMWLYRAVPDKMVMVYAMVFGAHLLPFGWYYQSKAYYIAGGAIPILVLIMGCLHNAAFVANCMVMIEVVFSLALLLEGRGVVDAEK